MVGLALLPKARFDHNPLNLRDVESESVATYLDLLADSRNAPWALSVLVPAGEARSTAKQLSDLAEKTAKGESEALSAMASQLKKTEEGLRHGMIHRMRRRGGRAPARNDDSW